MAYTCVLCRRFSEARIGLEVIVHIPLQPLRPADLAPDSLSEDP